MKRGINSLDAFLAIMIMLFITYWLQSTFTLSYDNSQDFGARVNMDSEAMYLGSIMNSFFATNPSSQDYVLFNSSVSMFGEDLLCTIIKEKDRTNVTVITFYDYSNYNSSYPVVAQIKYDPAFQRVST